MTNQGSFGGEAIAPRPTRLRTLQRILEATLDLMAEGGEDAVTIGNVAARVGVTERTVFRHIDSRERLLKSFWKAASGWYPPPRPPRTPDALVEKPRVRFRALARERDQVRTYLQSQTRPKGPRRRVDRERAAALIECVKTYMPYLDADELRRRTAIADLLQSPYALEFLQQFWGFGGKQAGQAAAEAIDILIANHPAY